MSPRSHPTLFYAALLLVCCLCACQGLPEQVSHPSPGPAPRILVTVTLGEAHEAALLDAFNSSSYRGRYDAPLSTRQQLQRLARDYRITERAGWVIESLGVYCGLYNMPPDEDVQALIDRLNADPRVESAQRLERYSTRAGPKYNDPYFALQYGNAQDFVLGLHQRATGLGVNVAIIDTGLDARHPELRHQIASEEVFLVGEASTPDPGIHGTAVAGVIAARANNKLGIVGLAPDARIHSLRACHQLDSHSSLAECDSFTVARAIDFAINRQLDIINLSLSGPPDPLVARLVAAALVRGQLITAADPGQGHQRYPALLPGVIAVREESGEYIDNAPEKETLVVRAPLTEVLSTGPGGGYDYYSGSSMATALVTALTALSLESEGRLSAAHRTDWLNRMLRQGLRPEVAKQGDPDTTTSDLTEHLEPDRWFARQASHAH
ncbi:serine protease [Seongchinamella sediminis]|uniref:Serine protease n=1 Tax=Seongchinamella sediminis TaxID=2283635 RepID=A0A3L7DX87_9GAMM|nr:S8 family serine peptidase [Seongchinamella sediminis]RLQ20422.1 serine protease [Seongchinamella sediminis]